MLINSLNRNTKIRDDKSSFLLIIDIRAITCSFLVESSERRITVNEQSGEKNAIKQWEFLNTCKTEEVWVTLQKGAGSERPLSRCECWKNEIGIGNCSDNLPPPKLFSVQVWYSERRPRYRGLDKGAFFYSLLSPFWPSSGFADVSRSSPYSCI